MPQRELLFNNYLNNHVVIIYLAYWYTNDFNNITLSLYSQYVRKIYYFRISSCCYREKEHRRTFSLSFPSFRKIKQVQLSSHFLISILLTHPIQQFFQFHRFKENSYTSIWPKAASRDTSTVDPWIRQGERLYWRGMKECLDKREEEEKVEVFLQGCKPAFPRGL